MKNQSKNKKNMETKTPIPMATSNMAILASLLQVPQILQYTDQVIQNEINALPPLNHYTTGTEPRRFCYSPEESAIGYISPELTQEPEYQEILTQAPILTFIGIEIYQD